MSADEDTELRDLIIESLEKKGVLAKIKAELRASVFLALEETENEKYKIPLSNEAIQKFQETKDGRTSLSLVRDFLEFFHLDYTLAVLDTEISPFKAIIKKHDLEKDLDLNSNTDAPLLTLLLRERSMSKMQQGSFGTSRKVDWENDFNVLQRNSKQENTFLVNNVTSDIADDPFFDEPVSAVKESLPFSITGTRNEPEMPLNKDNSLERTSVDKQIFPSSFVTNRGHSSDPSSEDDVLSGLLQKRTTKTNTPKTESTVQSSATSLSSLKDLPSLNAKPKEDSRSNWLEQFDNILHAAVFTGNCAQDDYEDDFQSSESGKSGSKVEGQKNGGHVKDNTEGSIDEDIEEDISIPADDLLNTSTSLGEDNDATSDRTISHISGAGGYDYMEKLS